MDGIIKKIGGSQDKGGIKGTLNIYKDGGIKGRPSIRSYGIWYFLYSTILKKAKIEFYMIYQENFVKDVKGLFGFKRVKNASINYKIIEECCILDYKEKENDRYPDWNVQEKGMDWPLDVKKEHAKLLNNSTSNKKSKRKNINI